MSDNPFDKYVPAKAGTSAEPSASSGNPFDQFVPKTGTSQASPSRGPLDVVERDVRGIENWLNTHVAKPVGGALTYGHAHPLEAFQAVAGAPQRALRASELDLFGGEHIDPRKAFMTPSMGDRLKSQVDTKLGIASGGTDDPRIPPHLRSSTARKLLRFGEDVVNDPVTVVPIGRAASLAAKVPAVTKAGKAVATVADRATGGIFNPDAYLKALTPEARAEFEAITNRAMEAVRHQKDAEDKIVATHADEIRQGVMPPEIAALFRSDRHTPQMDAWRDYFPEGLKKGTRPQDVQRALFRNRAPAFKTQAMNDLRARGFFTSPSGVAAGATNKFAIPTDEIADAQKHLEGVLDHAIRPEASNVILKGAQTLMHRGNQAFLANPVPHTGNLANLAYNEYGPITALRGLGNAARVATSTVGSGRLAQNIDELERAGAKSQYGNIFDELGLTRLAGMPGTESAARVANKVIIPLEKFSNVAQHKILNSTETGLRAAALDAEKARGVTGDQAAKNIHRTFGTDAPNAVTQGLQNLAVPFAKFHAQTAPGSVVRTLARNPGRITTPIKAERDLNSPSGPQYRSTVPGANAARMFADPEGYFAGNFGALGQLPNVVQRLQKGQVGRLTEDAAERYITLSPELQAAIEIARRKKGPAGQSGLQDLLSAIAGGYWTKNR